MILVGPDKVPFHVHSKILAQSSSVLAEFVAGSFQESIEKCAILDDVNPVTFSRAIEYMYSGDYPEPDVLRSSEVPPQEDGEIIPRAPKRLKFGFENDVVQGKQPYGENERETKEHGAVKANDGNNAPSTREPTTGEWHDFIDIKARKSMKDLIVEFQEHCGAKWSLVKVWQQQQTHRPIWRPFSNVVSSSILLCHAELYVFANRYSMPLLGALALEKLGSTLCVYKSHGKGVPGFLKLLEYTYENTQDRSPGIDKLRHLVITFSTIWSDRLLPNDEFKKMLEAEGALSRDFAMNLYRAIT